MKNLSLYQSAKIALKMVSIESKKNYKKDFPAIRQEINDTMDFLCKTYNLTEYERNLLSNYACKLHPKK